MEPSEISLKLAELALRAKQVEITSDLIKIGIPSIVALVGTISTIIVAFKSHQKDLTIARLNAEKEQEKEKARLKAELIKEISVNIGEIHAVAIRYVTFFASKIDLLTTGHPFPNMAELREHHTQLLSKLHDIYETETKVLLFGNVDVTEAFREFHTSLTSVCYKYNPQDSADLDRVHQDTFMVGQKKDALYKELSAQYLGEISSQSSATI